MSLLSKAELFEPTLLPYELASVARKKALKHPKDRDVILYLWVARLCGVPLLTFDERLGAAAR